MAGYFLAAEDASGWPDAFVAVAGMALFAFLIWVFFR